MKKIELSQMENLQGGAESPFTNAEECNKLANGMGGTALIIGAASWWSGAGAGLALIVSGVAYGYQQYCNSL